MSMSAYSFKTEDALKYGVEEAIILYHFRYWVANNKTNNAHNHDGRYWLYNSHKSLSELFPFFNEQKCKRLVQSLKDQGAILIGNYNKKGYDRTNWYTVNDDSSISQIEPIHQSNLTDGSVKNDRPIPNTTYHSLLLANTPSEAEASGKESKRRSSSSKEMNSSPELPPYKVKASQWYQHYLKSSIVEAKFNAFPESLKIKAFNIPDKEEFLTFVNENTPPGFTFVDPVAMKLAELGIVLG